ncbi:SsgA family sporulation/cell division regulator [Streptomyces sp. NPDC021212]|uniref:SsgA family sporulation/cell division regulator n=1 Tax=Streptomyces sp. NPDC021212 TaxID=3365118 RepID=UPI0037A342B7
MGNVTATEGDDFDALLKASSLGAPHVLAETEPIPADVYRRLSQAAAGPARPAAEPPAQDENECAAGPSLHPYALDDWVHDDVLSFPFRLRDLAEADRPRVTMVCGDGVGKTHALYLLRRRFLRETLSARSNHGKLQLYPQLGQIGQLRNCSAQHMVCFADELMGKLDVTLRWLELIASIDEDTCTLTFHASAAVTRLRMMLDACDAASERMTAPSESSLRPARMVELLVSGQTFVRGDTGTLWVCRQQYRCHEPMTLARPEHERTALTPGQAPLAWTGPKGTEGQPPSTARVWIGLTACRDQAASRPPEGSLALFRRTCALPRTSLPNGMVATFGNVHPAPPPSDQSWGTSLLLVSHLPDLWSPALAEVGRTESDLSSKETPEAHPAVGGQNHSPGSSRPPTKQPGTGAWISKGPDGSVLHARLKVTVHQEEGDQGEELPVGLTYRVADPYAVEAAFRPDGPGEPVVWTFARDLLIEGLNHSAGEGDVIVWSSAGRIWDIGHRTFIRLSSPEGTALLSVSRSQLKDYLDQTRCLCATGTEPLHLRGTLDALENELGELICPGSVD